MFSELYRSIGMVFAHTHTLSLSLSLSLSHTHTHTYMETHTHTLSYICRHTHKRSCLGCQMSEAHLRRVMYLFIYPSIYIFIFICIYFSRSVPTHDDK